jgi:hypothetical protein
MRSLAACVSISAEQYVVALVEPRSLRLNVAHSPEELGRALRPFEPPVAVPLARPVADARTDFWRFAIVERPRPR